MEGSPRLFFAVRACVDFAVAAAVIGFFSVNSATLGNWYGPGEYLPALVGVPVMGAVSAIEAGLGGRIRSSRPASRVGSVLHVLLGAYLVAIGSSTGFISSGPIPVVVIQAGWMLLTVPASFLLVGGGLGLLMLAPSERLESGGPPIDRDR